MTEIAEKVRFWEEQQRINSLVIPRVAELTSAASSAQQQLATLTSQASAAEARLAAANRALLSRIDILEARVNELSQALAAPQAHAGSLSRPRLLTGVALVTSLVSLMLSLIGLLS